MKKIEIQVYTRQEIEEMRDRALKTFNEYYAKKKHLTDFEKFCMDSYKSLVENCNSWLESFPNDVDFYLL